MKQMPSKKDCHRGQYFCEEVMVAYTEMVVVEMNRKECRHSGIPDGLDIQLKEPGHSIRDSRCLGLSSWVSTGLCAYGGILCLVGPL